MQRFLVTLHIPATQKPADGEPNQLAVSVLLEDFKARWQELLNFESEVNRLVSLYASALILGVAWILAADKYKSLKQIFTTNDNAYFVLSLVFVNAAFALSTALKGYQIQQIALYIDEEIADRIKDLAGVEFNTWEVWRRRRFQGRRAGGPEWVRVYFYATVSLLPLSVSGVILFLYWYYVGSCDVWNSANNLYAYAITTLTLGHALATVSTTRINRLWKERVTALDHAGSRQSTTDEQG